MHAQEFWDMFQREYSAYSSATPDGFGKGYGPAWTNGMYNVLHRLKQEAHLHCECRQSHDDGQGRTIRGERMNIDFFWYPENGDRLEAPVVVIEHENLQENVAEDFWKVSQTNAPLRVCIGYAETADGIGHFSDQLLDMAERAHWRCPAGSEDLLILGDYNPCERFRAWTRKAGGGWHELPARPQPGA